MSVTPKELIYEIEEQERRRHPAKDQTAPYRAAHSALARNAGGAS